MGSDAESNRSERIQRLLAHRTWLAERLTQHAGNVPVVHRLLAKEHGIEARLRSVQRFAASWLAEQRRTAPAVPRFETLPGSQLQLDFGTQRVPIAGVHAPVHILVAILGSSRRVYVQALPDESQASWWRGLEGALRPFGWVPLEVLMDHAKALPTSTTFPVFSASPKS